MNENLTDSEQKLSIVQRKIRCANTGLYAYKKLNLSKYETTLKLHSQIYLELVNKRVLRKDECKNKPSKSGSDQKIT